MSDTKMPVPNSRGEQYLANVLSVLGGSEAVYDPGLPQSREEQYLTAILKLMKEKGNGGEIISCTIDEETGDGTLAKAPTSKSYIIDFSGVYLVMNDFGDLNPIQPGDHTYLGYEFANIQPDSTEINIIQFSSKGTKVVIKQVTVPANVTINNYLTIASAESTYAKKTDLNAYAKTAELEKKIPNPPSTNGTYVYKATRTDSGVTFEWVLES